MRLGALEAGGTKMVCAIENFYPDRDTGNYRSEND